MRKVDRRVNQTTVMALAFARTCVALQPHLVSRLYQACADSAKNAVKERPVLGTMGPPRKAADGRYLGTPQRGELCEY